MENNTHKGSELRNVSETWDQNERERADQSQENEGREVPAASELDRLVQEESAEYDQNTAEDGLLSGERATVSDEEESRNPDT